MRMLLHLANTATYRLALWKGTSWTQVPQEQSLQTKIASSTFKKSQVEYSRWQVATQFQYLDSVQYYYAKGHALSYQDQYIALESLREV